LIVTNVLALRNVRELKNPGQRALALCVGKTRRLLERKAILNGTSPDVLTAARQMSALAETEIRVDYALRSQASAAQEAGQTVVRNTASRKPLQPGARILSH
jgi:hypothetical protein